MTYPKGTKVSFDVEAMSTPLSGNESSIGCQTFRTAELLDVLRENGGTARISGRVTGEADGDGSVTIGGRLFRESQIRDVARNLTTEAPAKPEPTWQDGDSVLYEGEFRYRHGGAWLDDQGVERLHVGQDKFYTDLIGKGPYGVEPLVMGGKVWQATNDPATLSWQAGDQVKYGSGTRTRVTNGRWVIDSHGGDSTYDDERWDREIANGHATVLRKGGVDFTTQLAAAA